MPNFRTEIRHVPFSAPRLPYSLDFHPEKGEDDMTETVHTSIAEAESLARRALAGAGAGDEVAELMARALIEAETLGLAGVGLAHLQTYCEALRAGRIDGQAQPGIRRLSTVAFHADARGGVGHVAFDRLMPELVVAAHEHGVAVACIANSFTNAALDWFVRRLAGQGLVALAATNGGPALLAGSGSTRPVFCTNPLAFAVPRGEEPPLVIDQSCSATAFVNLRLAAERGEAIPEGWALDRDGAPTTDPVAALTGVLLPFGGARGGNVALVVELLAAGLSGGNWSLDAPSFLEGEESPGIGLFVLALDGERLSGGDLAARAHAYLQRLERDFGVYLPGASRARKARQAVETGIAVDADLHRRLLAFAGG